MRPVHSRWPWLLVVVAVAAVGWWLLRPRDGAPGAPDAPSVPAATQPPSASAAPAPTGPAVRHPLEPAEADTAADAAIPALADSDAAAWAALAGQVDDASVLEVLLRDHLVQRLVVMIDNLTEPRINTRALAMGALPGDFTTEADDAGLRIAAANARRYEPYVRAFVQADPARLAAAYRRFYPLFQQAYAELAGPDAYFNDRLVEVIDHLLRAPEPDAAPQVEADARGRFRHVDPRLESLSVGQKALVRLSPDQRRAVKQQLRAIRRALAAG